MGEVVPTYLRRRLRDHQRAINCSDERLIEVLCEYIEACDAGDQPLPHEDNVYSATLFVMDKLTEGPIHAPR